MEKEKKNILKAIYIKIIIYIILFNINIMLYNFNSYDLIIDSILLIVNILLYLLIKNSIKYYNIKIYVYNKKILIN